jgi:vacuolar-type H+-ATPase subunit H
VVVVKKAEGDKNARVLNAEGDAKAKIVNAQADANVFSVVGKAKAENTLAVGTAEAEVIQKKTTAVGQSNYALIEVGRALAEAKIPLVPQIMVAGGGKEGNNSLVDVLLANLVAKNMDVCQWRSKNVPPGRSKSVPVGTLLPVVVLAEVRSGRSQKHKRSALGIYSVTGLAEGFR